MKCLKLLCLITIWTIASAQREVYSQIVSQPVAAQEQIEQLDSTPIAAAQWNNAGFATPQKTAQTFMWAMRERNFDVLNKCRSDASQGKTMKRDEGRLEKARHAAQSLETIAVKWVDETTVMLKFKVRGWGDNAMQHKLKKTSDGWKLDGESSTSDADW